MGAYDSTPGVIMVLVIIAVVILYFWLKSKIARNAAAEMKAEGAIARIGDMRLTATELLIGEQRYPLAGLHATVEDSGSVNRRLTITRLATLGVAAVAIPKKLDDRDVYVTVEGPGVAVVRVMHAKDIADAGLIGRKFAAELNMRAAHDATV